MNPKDLFGKYATYVFIIYTILKIVFENDAGNSEIPKDSKPVPSTDLVQKNVASSGNSRNVNRNTRGRAEE